MDMTLGGALESETVTLWCFVSEGEDGVAVWHPIVLQAYLAHGRRAAELSLGTGGCRGTELQLRGFLFAPDGGELSVPMPMPGCDRMTLGVGLASESPFACDGPVYLITDADRPPRMSDGMLVDWLHFTAEADGGRR